jgi:hypothetical protein
MDGVREDIQRLVGRHLCLKSIQESGLNRLNLEYNMIIIPRL